MVLVEEQITPPLDFSIKIACNAFCPHCGADLYYLDNECICKNKDCSWSCL